MKVDKRGKKKMKEDKKIDAGSEKAAKGWQDSRTILLAKAGKENMRGCV